MKLNPKKLKCNAEIGDKLDLVPAIAMYVSLFGIGIFYWFFSADIFLRFFDFIALVLFSVVFVISFVLYGIGLINRRCAEKTVFNYIDESVLSVADEICNSENIKIDLNLNITKRGVIFTLTGGTVKAAFDLTPAKKLPVAATLFIDVCLGVIGTKINGNMAEGKAYKNVSYTIIINDNSPDGQNFVKDGEPNKDELQRVIKFYEKRVRKYRKKKK